MDLKFELPLGYNLGGTYVRDIELLKSNAIAEEVFTKKLAERPYTWIGNVISVATKSLGETEVGANVRESYLKTGGVTIPSAVKTLPLSDANSLLVEIHRRVWQNLIPKQSILCKFCGKKAIADIDLNRIEMSEKNKELLITRPVFTALETTLTSGIDLTKWIEQAKLDKDFAYLKGVSLNKITFRIPTLGDAIKNEAYAGKSIEFWRRMAVDCIISLEAIDAEGQVIERFPEEKLVWLGLKIFDFMESEDLRKVRYTLREELPTMPFVYEDECPCDQKRTIPFAMEASAFFSE